MQLGRVLLGVAVDVLTFMGMALRSRTALAAENLSLRKQLASYRERQVSPRRASHSIRLALVLLARWCAWREALAAPYAYGFVLHDRDSIYSPCLDAALGPRQSANAYSLRDLGASPIHRVCVACPSAAQVSQHPN